MTRRHDDDQWHRISATLRSMDDDAARGIARDTANLLAGTILLLVREGTQPPVQYLWGDTSRLHKAGRIVGMEAHPLGDGDDTDGWPELPGNARASAHAIVPWRARLSQVANMERLRTDMSKVRTNLETMMPADSWVAVSTRPYGTLERRRVDGWCVAERNRQDDQNELTQGGAAAIRVTAGGVDTATAKTLARDAGQALFPLLDDMRAHRSRPRLGLAVASTLVTLTVALSVGLGPVPPLPALAAALALSALVLLTGWCVWWVATGNSMWPVAGLATIPPAIMAIMAIPWPVWAPFLLLPLPLAAWVRWWRRDPAWDDIMQPVRHWWWPLPPRRRTTRADRETMMGQDDRERVIAAYPTIRSTLLMGSQTLLAAITPPRSAAAATGQDMHPVPAPLAQEGIPLGVDQTGRAAHLLPSQLYGGVAIFGAAGRGKSVLTHGIMQWAIHHRDDSDPAEWGPDSRIIDFEMKDDDGVRVLRRYRDTLWDFRTDPAQRWRFGHVSYLADPDTPCPDMLGMRDGLDARATAVNIAKAMQYAFEPGDILNDSLDVIATVMTIAVAMQRRADRDGDGGVALARRITGMEAQYPGSGRARPQKSPIGWALMALAGSDGQVGTARALGHLCAALTVEDPDDMDMRLAARAAEQLYGRPDAKGAARVGDQRILDRTSASRNKVRQFMDCEHVFTTRRGVITWARVLATPGDYHFVLCDRTMPDGGTLRLPDGMGRRLGKWMKHRLWGEVGRQCQNWRAQGRHTMFVCDELSLLADEDDPVLRAMKDQGRSFGWVNVVATQYATQLSPRLLKSVMGYSTFISFDNPDVDMAGMTARQLTSDGGADGWTAAAVQNLPKYTAAVRTRDDSQLQPAFLVHVTDFDKGLRDGDHPTPEGRVA